MFLTAGDMFCNGLKSGNPKSGIFGITGVGTCGLIFGLGPVTFGESLRISEPGIGSAIDGSLPIDGGLFGKRMTGPRGRDGVNFGGIEIFGSILGICPLNLAFKLLNKPITNSVELRQRKCPSSYT